MSAVAAIRTSGVKLPWSGTSPWRLAIRGLVHLVLGGVVAWGCAQVVWGDIDLDEGDLAEQASAITTAATVALVAAVGLALYGLVRVVVGAVDIASPRQVVRGRLVRADERMAGDFLPRAAQLALGWARHRRRHDHHHDPHHGRWHELVVDTDGGQRRFTVSRRIFDTARPGAPVAVHATRILGHVAEVEVLADS